MASSKRPDFRVKLAKCVKRVGIACAKTNHEFIGSHGGVEITHTMICIGHQDMCASITWFHAKELIALGQAPPTNAHT